MRNGLLITAALFCLATSVLAANDQQNAQPQSKQAEHTQMARYDAEGSMDQASAQSNCMPTTGQNSKPSKNKQQDDPEGDPHASQNRVEYGGAG